MSDRRRLARELRRREQLSIDQLSERLGVARSTVYGWVRDLPVPGSGPGGGFSEEARLRGSRKMAEGSRRLRELQYRCGVEQYAALRGESAFRDFIVSYLGLGKKGDRREVSFSHPDPLLMQIACHWMKCFGRNRLRFRLILPRDGDADRARAFWAERLDVPASVIKVEWRKGQPSPDSSATKHDLLGTLRVMATDTMLRTALQAWIDCARAEWRRAIGRRPSPARRVDQSAAGALRIRGGFGA
jgi:hypothetical protein